MTNITEMEAKNSRLYTGLLHKTDQQQLLQGTTREETCTLENCVNAELKNNPAQNRFEKMARISIFIAIIVAPPPHFMLLYFSYEKEGVSVRVFVRFIFGSKRSTS